MQTYTININHNGIRKEAYIIKDEENIIFIFDDIRIEENDVFPFRALQSLRKTLEQKNIYLLINGSRKDVYPGGMLLHSEYAYKLIIGKHNNDEDKLHIFSNAKYEELISSVEDQNKFHEIWGESILKG